MPLRLKQISAAPDEPEEARENLPKPDGGPKLSLPELKLYRSLTADVERWQRMVLPDLLRPSTLSAIESIQGSLQATNTSVIQQALESLKGVYTPELQSTLQTAMGAVAKPAFQQTLQQMLASARAPMLEAMEHIQSVNTSIIQQAMESFRTIGMSGILETLASLSWRPDVGPTIIIRPTPGTFMGDVLLVSNGSIEQPEVQEALDRLIANRFAYWRVFIGLRKDDPFQQGLWPRMAKPALYEAIRDMPEDLPTSEIEAYLLNYLARRCGGISFSGWTSVQVVMVTRPVEGGAQAGRQLRGKGGAPRLEERPDWPAKAKIARSWVDRWQTGRVTQEAAAALEGYDVDTLRDWARRAGYML